MIVRVVVFGVLALLLLLALLDYQAKRSAQTTAETWRAALKSKSEHEVLVKSEFSKLTVNGRPQMVSAAAEPNPYAAKTVETYTWPGIFRSYSVKVYFGLSNDPPVEWITGPGAEAEQSE